MTLPGRISLVTLGVADVARSTAFYDALGWDRSEDSNDSVSFYRLAGAALSLYGLEALAEDAQVAPERNGFSGVAAAINLESAAAVDAGLAAAAAAGATILKPAQTAFWGGYSGYFADPDGHTWEVAHNPHWPLDDEGLPQLP